MPSWRKHRIALIRSMLGFGDIMDHIEPVLLIADYYGEKQAMYFAFLIHHISLLTVPAFFGLILWGYHLWLASVYVPKADEPTGYVSYYFAILDTKWNYPYLFLLAVWSTVYIESWKRKQNTVKYIWASEQRIKDIKSSEKKEQRNATYFIEKVSGKKTLSVLVEKGMINFFKTIGLLLLAMVVAWCIWYLCMKQFGIWMLEIEAINDKAYKLYRLWVNIIIYSIAVIYFNRFFKSAAAKIVTAENKKYKKDHEESMVQKSYSLGFFNSYLGMGWAAFIDKALVNVCGLLLSVLMLKQIIMSSIELCEPKCKEPKRFRAHKQKIMAHFMAYPADYGKEDG